MSLKQTLTWAMMTAVVLAIGPVAASADDFPTKPIRWIVPFNPGGGTDATARVIAKVIEEQHLLPEPVAIVNVAGAGGSIGARQVKDAAPDGYTLLIDHSALMIQSANGMADFGPQDFEAVISLNRQCMVAVVSKDSTYQTYADLINAAKKDPGKLVWTGNIGSSNHMAVAVMEAATPGVQFKKVQGGGDAETYAALKGGFATVGNFGVSGSLAYAKDIRTLALLTDKRDPAIPDVPTAKEQGYDAEFCNEHNLYVPKGTPPERIKILADAFEKALNSDEVKDAYAKQIGATQVLLRGDALNKHIEDYTQLLKPLAMQMTAPK
jgi:tripartite-type tricarboxylate transporter receptor subunit TctC